MDDEAFLAAWEPLSCWVIVSLLFYWQLLELWPWGLFINCDKLQRLYSETEPTH